MRRKTEISPSRSNFKSRSLSRRSDAAPSTSSLDGTRRSVLMNRTNPSSSVSFLSGDATPAIKAASVSFIQTHLPHQLRPLMFFAGEPALTTISQLPDLVKDVKRMCAFTDSEGIESAVQSSPTASKPPRTAKEVSGRPHLPVVIAAKKMNGTAAGEAPLILAKLEQLQWNIFPVAATSAAEERVMISAASQVPLTVPWHNKKNLWKRLLQKSTSLFPLLTAAARSDVTLTDVRVGAVLLSFIYNLLQELPFEKQRRAARLCENLGLVRTCMTILQRHHTSINDSGDQGLLYATIRVNEAAVLLLSIASMHNTKVAVVLRLSRDSRKMLQVAESAFQLLGTKLSNYRKLSDFDCVMPKPSLKGKSGEATANAHQALREVERLVRASSGASSAFVHACISLFFLAKSPATAQELGPRCVGICCHALNVLAVFRYRMIAKLVSVVAAGFEELQPAEVTKEAASMCWVAQWIRHLEAAVFWSIALLQRVCANSKAAALNSEEAHKWNAYTTLFLVISSIAEEGYSGAAISDDEGTSVAYQTLIGNHHRSDIVYASLVLMASIMQGNRPLGIEMLKPLGGTAAVVRVVLRLPERRLTQWQQYYLLLSALYGLSRLPSGDESPSALNMRVPSYLRFPTLTPSPPRMRATRSNSDLINSVRDGFSDGSADGSLSVPRGYPLTSLLPVDRNPQWFSPELAGGRAVEQSTVVPPEGTVTLPWQFLDPSIPSSQEEPNHLDESPPKPLTPSSSEQQVAVLQHHVARLQLLNDKRDDSSENSDSHHRYRVVYERSNGSSGSPRMESQPQSLYFRANFPCGNLQRAIKVSPEEYDLVLAWDTSTNSFTQWFCFSVGNYDPGRTYTFNILNMEKKGSTFNDGQRPLMYHVRSSRPAGPVPPKDDWKRVGHDIFYFQNPYARPARESLKGHRPTQTQLARSGVTQCASPTLPTHPRSRATTRRAPPAASPTTSFNTSPPRGRPPKKAGGTVRHPAEGPKLFTLSFKVTMPSDGGVVYFANCFPYTYADLLQHLESLGSRYAQRGAVGESPFTVQSLCTSLGGLPVPIVTATASINADGVRYTTEEIRARPICVLTARIHPGETNSSYVMHGLLDALAGGRDESTPRVADVSRALLQRFVFKIVPMLNPDGVLMGNHRCSLAGVDLNRDYLHPEPETNPVIYSLKQLLRHHMQREQRPVTLFTDFHGHSRATNFLIYGCTQATAAATSKGKKKGAPEECASLGGEGDGGPPPPDPFAPEKILPTVLSNVCPSFSISQSSFATAKSKRNTGRVVMHQQFGIRMSYTVEGTMVGGKGANYRCVGEVPPRSSSAWDSMQLDSHYSQGTYMNMGVSFLLSLKMLCDAEDDARRAMEGDQITNETRVPAMDQTWEQVAMAGIGKQPPKEELFGEVPETLSVPRLPSVGSYAVGCLEHRGGVPTSESSSLVECSRLPLAYKLDALQYLLRGSLMAFEDGGEDEEEDSDEAESDGDDIGSVHGPQQKERIATLKVLSHVPRTDGDSQDDGDDDLLSLDDDVEDNDGISPLEGGADDDGLLLPPGEMINASFFRL